MSKASQHRQFGPLVAAVLGLLVYAGLLWVATPNDLPDYWQAFFRVRAGQVLGLALATCFYVAGLALCLVAFSSLLPLRSLFVRRFLGIPGFLSLGFGITYILAILVCFTDKVR